MIWLGTKLKNLGLATLLSYQICSFGFRSDICVGNQRSYLTNLLNHAFILFFVFIFAFFVYGGTVMLGQEKPFPIC